MIMIKNHNMLSDFVSSSVPIFHRNVYRTQKFILDTFLVSQNTRIDVLF